MKVTKQRLTNKVYDLLRKTTPFCNIDLIIKNNNKFLLGKRIIKPYAGLWSVPGGRIRKGEKIVNAIIRIAKREVDILVDKPHLVGVYEGLSNYRHDISLTYIVNYLEGTPRIDYQHSNFQWFSKIPNNTISFQKKALKDAVFFTKLNGSALKRK